MATLFTHMSDAYNIKLIQYGNGTTEVRVYHDCVNAIDLFDDSLAYMDLESYQIQQNEKRKKHKEMALQSQEKYREEHKTFNPFTEEVEYIPTFDEIDLVGFAHERSVKSSLNRTVNAIYKYSRQCKWEYFITLTFNDECVDRFDFSACMKKAGKWFNNQRDRCAPDLKYLYVPEQHQNGAWHIHGVIADVGAMEITDSGRVSKNGKAYIRDDSNSDCAVIYNLSGWRFGWSTATVVKDTHKVSTYITKYITKDLCESSKNRKRYYRSRNIPEPEEQTFLVETTDREEFLRTLENSLGFEQPTYMKSIDGYLSVDYRFYQNDDDEREEKKNDGSTD